MTTRNKSNAAGSALVWALVSLCLLCSAFASLDFFADPRYRDPLCIWLLEGGLLFACLGLWFQARRDLYKVSLYLLVVSSLTALATGAVVLLASQWHPIAAMVCVVMTASALGCLVGVMRVEETRLGRPRFSLAG